MKSVIDGVVLQDLRIIPADGGPVLHMLRADSPLFRSFGELYFSEVEPGSVKAWKRHAVQTQPFRGAGRAGSGSCCMMTGRIRRPGAQLWKLFWDAPISTVFYGFLRVSGMVLRLWGASPR